jgi:hypothetical protein
MDGPRVRADGHISMTTALTEFGPSAVCHEWAVSLPA